MLCIFSQCKGTHEFNWIWPKVIQIKPHHVINTDLVIYISAFNYLQKHIGSEVTLKLFWCCKCCVICNGNSPVGVVLLKATYFGTSSLGLWGDVAGLLRCQTFIRGISRWEAASISEPEILFSMWPLEHAPSLDLGPSFLWEDLPVTGSVLLQKI